MLIFAKMPVDIQTFLFDCHTRNSDTANCFDTSCLKEAGKNFTALGVKYSAYAEALSVERAKKMSIFVNIISAVSKVLATATTAKTDVVSAVQASMAQNLINLGRIETAKNQVKLKCLEKSLDYISSRFMYFSGPFTNFGI